MIQCRKKGRQKNKSLYASKSIYIESSKGVNQASVLNDFVARLEKDKDDTSKYEQIVFEYKKSYNDDEDHTSFRSMRRHSTPTNHLTIFFSSKKQIYRVFGTFIKSTCKRVDMTKYEEYGTHTKACVCYMVLLDVGNHR